MLDRLARSAGQVRGVSKMVQDRRSCARVVLQVMAARTALEQVKAAVINTSSDEDLALPPEETRVGIGRGVELLTKAEDGNNGRHTARDLGPARGGRGLVGP